MTVGAQTATEAPGAAGAGPDPAPPLVEVGPTVNGVRRAVRTEPRRLLVDVLRQDLGGTATPTSCADGVCGTCTVLVDGDPVRSCLMLAHECDGKAVRTLEGVLAGPLGATLPQVFSKHHAIQCGFCTPGFMVLAAAMVEAGAPVTDDDLVELVSENVCRCTGYGPILDAFRELARDHGLWRGAVAG